MQIFMKSSRVTRILEVFRLLVARALRHLSRLRERSTRSKSAAGEGSILLGSLPSGDTLSPTLSRRRERGRGLCVAAVRAASSCLRRAVDRFIHGSRDVAHADD